MISHETFILDLCQSSRTFARSFIFIFFCIFLTSSEVHCFNNINSNSNSKYLRNSIHSHNTALFQYGKVNSPIVMSLQGQTGFLYEKDQNNYLQAILRKSVISTKLLIEEGKNRIEIEFPANRKNDLSLGETYDTNRQFTKVFLEAFSSYKKDLWVVFPDRKECSLAMEKWGGDESNYFTLTSIESLIKNNPDIVPKILVVVNPGFSVDEWINIPKIDRGVPIVIINGNLDRLRNGYYPWFIYPALTKVSKEYYSTYTPALFLQPIAVGGDRMGAWMTKIYPNKWEIFVKGDKEYNSISISDTEPEPKVAWNLAKKKYLEYTGQMF